MISMSAAETMATSLANRAAISGCKKVWNPWQRKNRTHTYFINDL